LNEPEAISAIRGTAHDLPSDPLTAVDRERVYRAIHALLSPGIHFSIDQCCQAWVGYCKRGKENDNTIVVGKTHGVRCFWAGRGRGPCDGEMSVDRLVPGSRGGLYRLENCVIACRRHNSVRGDRTIEEFLGGDATGTARERKLFDLGDDAETADARFGRRSP